MVLEIKPSNERELVLAYRQLLKEAQASTQHLPADPIYAADCAQQIYDIMTNSPHVFSVEEIRDAENLANNLYKESSSTKRVGMPKLVKVLGETELTHEDRLSSLRSKKEYKPSA